MAGKHCGVQSSRKSNLVAGNFLKVTCITYAVLERLFSDVYEILQCAAEVQDSLTAKRVSARLSERRRKPGACRPCQCFKDEQVTHLILIC